MSTELEHMLIVRTANVGDGMQVYPECQEKRSSPISPAMRIVNSFGPEALRVVRLNEIHVGSDTVGGHIEHAIRLGEQPEVVVDNVVKASRVFQTLAQLRRLLGRRLVLAIAGPSGAGKSEFAALLASYLIEHDQSCYVLGVDNYYNLDPRENELERSRILERDGVDALREYLGSQAELDLNRISGIVEGFKAGVSKFPLRIMDIDQSCLAHEERETDLSGKDILIVEGTWSLLLPNVDLFVFLYSYPEITLERRVKRGREPITPVGEQVLALEQEKLIQNSSRSHVVVYEDYSIEIPQGVLSTEIQAPSRTPSETAKRELEKFWRKSSAHSGQGATLQSEYRSSHIAAPHCALPWFTREAAADNARGLLERALTPYGFVASISDQWNYRRIWSRDSVVTGLAGLLYEDDQLAEGLRVSLDSLASGSGPDGQIPSNLSLDKQGELKSVSLGGLAGRVDAIAWFAIGVYQYAHFKGDRAFAERHRPLIERGLELLTVWEFNRRGLIYVPQGGDWADEYIYHGYILLPQLLRLWALQCHHAFWPESELAARIRSLRELLDLNFWPRSSEHDPQPMYHPQAYKKFLANRGEAEFYQANLNPAGYATQYDFFGNSVATLLSLGDRSRREQTIQNGLGIIEKLATRITPSFWPPIFQGDPEWPLLTQAYRDLFRNEPFEYHNGGSWPMITGWFGAALVSQGELERARELLNDLNISNSKGRQGEWEFAECSSSLTGQPSGVPEQAWSASACLMLEGALGGKALFMGSIEC